MTASTDAFFAPPNEIVPSQLQGELAHLLDTLRTRFDRRGVRTLLPAKVSGTTRWYGIAPSHRDGRLLRDEIRCCLSRPLTSGQVDVVRTTPDSVDQAALQLVPTGLAIRVNVTPGWLEPVRRNVDTLATVWALEPDRRIDQPRPLGRVLRKFYENLVCGDRSQAEAALDELRGRAMLSATNLRFLRVEMLTALGTPQEMRDDPALKDISSLARPRSVTERLAEAADALIVAPTVDSPTDANLHAAADRIDIAWPGLVTHAYQVTSSATGRCYALEQLRRESPQEHHLRELLDRYPQDAVIAGVVGAITVPHVPQQGPVTALSLYHDGEYEAALNMARSESPSRSDASIALAAAVNLREPTAAMHALALVAQLSSSDRSLLLANAVEGNFVERLQALTAEQRVPVDWLDWLNGDWPDRPDLLAEWSRGWARTPDSPTTADHLAEALIDALHDSRRARVRNGIALLAEWLTGDGLPPSAVTLATTVFDIMLSSEPGNTERQAALVLLEAVLAVGCTSVEYGEMVEAIARELPLIGPRDAIWLAQVVDLLLLYACPAPDQRTTVIAHAVGVAQAWSDRIDPNDASVLRLLFHAAGTDFAVTDEHEASGRVVRSFKSVGIYSLMEGAIRTVTAWIEERWPGVKVNGSSEADNSRSLTALAEGADVMLVQTSHAKHAATGAIEVAVSDPSRLVLVNGRGASSLMRGLLDWAEGAVL